MLPLYLNDECKKNKVSKKNIKFLINYCDNILWYIDEDDKKFFSIIQNIKFDGLLIFYENMFKLSTMIDLNRSDINIIKDVTNIFNLNSKDFSNIFCKHCKVYSRANNIVVSHMNIFFDLPVFDIGQCFKNKYPNIVYSILCIKLLSQLIVKNQHFQIISNDCCKLIVFFLKFK
jgi:hypothetical protein